MSDFNDIKETEDDICDLNPQKICDSCGKCLETDKHYASIKITAIEKNTEN